LQAVAAGVNLEQVLLGREEGAEQLLVSQEQLDGLLAAAAAAQQQLHTATMTRLTAKLLVSPCNSSACRQQQLASYIAQAVLYRQCSFNVDSMELVAADIAYMQQQMAVLAQQQEPAYTFNLVLTVHSPMHLQNEAEGMRLQNALLAEGAAGMWDMLADSSSTRSTGLTGATLRGLMAALRKPVLSGVVQLPAACAVWHACMMAKPRERLVQVR
jgi:hypothetical protein